MDVMGRDIEGRA